YLGGIEHAVLHLLYARFWHKVLFDLGHLSTTEPFQKLVNQGLILGEDGQKMSKSVGNVVNPDDVITEYGADSLRLYEMFMGPLEQVKPWSMKGVEGVYRFLARVWRLVMETNQEGEWVLNTKLADIDPDKATNKVVHATIKKVGEDIDAMSFNTAISQMMVCTNEFTKLEIVPVSSVVLLLKVLNPFAPHLTEELNATLAAAFPSVDQSDLANQLWPVFDPAKLIEDEIEIVLQVNGKVRDKLFVANGASNEAVEKLALESEKVKGFTAGLTIRKVIVVPGRLVNVVAN
ncbi:MAG TPA: class I tRNA ligase family protein, partial [Verrucomicrobiales bacterium]|nr:class I tRNA ligase family protein [Verrucomicrobiales bacterium]